MLAKIQSVFDQLEKQRHVLQVNDGDGDGGRICNNRLNTVEIPRFESNNVEGWFSKLVDSSRKEMKDISIDDYKSSTLLHFTELNQSMNTNKGTDLPSLSYDFTDVVADVTEIEVNSAIVNSAYQVFDENPERISDENNDEIVVQVSDKSVIYDVDDVRELEKVKNLDDNSTLVRRHFHDENGGLSRDVLVKVSRGKVMEFRPFGDIVCFLYDFWGQKYFTKGILGTRMVMQIETFGWKPGWISFVRNNNEFKPIADRLSKLTVALGFDGWLMNMEVCGHLTIDDRYQVSLDNKLSEKTPVYLVAADSKSGDTLLAWNEYRKIDMIQVGFNRLKFHGLQELEPVMSNLVMQPFELLCCVCLKVRGCDERVVSGLNVLAGINLPTLSTTMALKAVVVNNGKRRVVAKNMGNNFNKSVIVKTGELNRLITLCSAFFEVPFVLQEVVPIISVHWRGLSIYKGDYTAVVKVESVINRDLGGCETCKGRGLLGLFIIDKLHRQICDWLDWSLNHLVPSSLLIISGVCSKMERMLHIFGPKPQLVIYEFGESVDYLTVKHFSVERQLEFNEIAENKEDYDELCGTFSKSLKVGVYENIQNRANLANLLRFQSKNSNDEVTSLKKYVIGMKEGQKDIYYFIGEIKEIVGRFSIRWGNIECQLPSGKTMSATESFIQVLDEKTSASLKFKVFNPKGRSWTMVAVSGAIVIYADTVGDIGYAFELEKDVLSFITVVCMNPMTNLVHARVSDDQINPLGIHWGGLLIFNADSGKDVVYIHSHVLHRNLKPNSVWMDWIILRPELADLGLTRASSLPAKKHTQESLTFWYRDPEHICKSSNTDKNCGNTDCGEMVIDGFESVSNMGKEAECQVIIARLVPSRSAIKEKGLVQGTDIGLKVSN